MDFTRQMTLSNPTHFRHKEVTIIGAGGIGAMTALLMAKCGFEHITVYDFDTLEPENGPSQMLPLSASDRIKDNLFYGAFKVHVLAHLIFDMTLTTIMPESCAYVDQPLTEVVVSAVDSMSTRQRIWEQAKSDPKVAFLVDGRMGRESLAIYAVDLLNRQNCDWYESTLHEDADALEIPCTEKATIFTNAQIGSWITKLIAAWSCENPWKKLMRINMANYLVVTG